MRSRRAAQALLLVGFLLLLVLASLAAMAKVKTADGSAPCGSVSQPGDAADSVACASRLSTRRHLVVGLSIGALGALATVLLIRRPAEDVAPDA